MAADPSWFSLLLLPRTTLTRSWCRVDCNASHGLMFCNVFVLVVVVVETTNSRRRCRCRTDGTNAAIDKGAVHDASHTAADDDDEVNGNRKASSNKD